MNGVALALTLATLGVDYSFRTAEEGQVEYTIQIEPEFLKSLAEGEEIHSDVPAEAGHVQRVCVRIGTTPVRHTAASIQQFKRLLVAAPRYATTDAALAGGDAQRTILWPGRSNPEESFGVDYGWQPDQQGQVAYFLQIDSTTLKTLAAGDEIHAAIDPSAGRVGRFVISSGNKPLPRVSPPPAEVATIGPQPQPVSKSRSRFQTGDDAGAPPLATMPTDGSFRAGDYGAASGAPAVGTDIPNAYQPSAPRFGTSREPPASDLRAPALAPATGGYAGGSTLLETPRGGFNQSPTASRPTATYPPNNEPALNDPRGYNGAAPPVATGGRFDQYRGNTLQPPVDTAPPPSYVQPVGAEQPRYQDQPYQQPTTRYSPQVAGDRFASAPQPTTNAGTLPPRTAANDLPASAAAAMTPLAKDQWWWPYWLFVVFSLFLSIGGNLYLGWTAAEFYSRYRLAVDRLRTAGRA
jgi:hypothetical protein